MAISGHWNCSNQLNMQSFIGRQSIHKKKQIRFKYLCSNFGNIVYLFCMRFSKVIIHWIFCFFIIPDWCFILIVSRQNRPISKLSSTWMTKDLLKLRSYPMDITGPNTSLTLSTQTQFAHVFNTQMLMKVNVSDVPRTSNNVTWYFALESLD